MQDRIRRFLAQRTEMLAGVSHDLRTPLTRLKLEAALAPPSPRITEIKRDLAEMEHMVDEYLAFARGEGFEGTRHLGAARRRQVSQNRDRKARHQRAGDPHDANRPAARGGCDGHDGIRRGHRLRQPRFLATSASTTWLTRHCCAIDSTVLVSQ